MTPEKKIIQLLAKKMGQAASDKEVAELQKSLQQNPEYSFLIEILQSLETEKLHKEPALQEDDLMQESWLMLQQELDGLQNTDEVEFTGELYTAKRNWSGTWIGRAAIWGSIVLLVGSAVFIIKNNKQKEASREVDNISLVGVSNGAPVKKVLPDGSEVWLNADSHIRYNDNFIQKNREVYLKGEAYFKVAHDANHPFIVHAGNISIRALGTTFNVHAYQNESRIEATLITGKILVKIDGKPDQDIILIPNEKLTVINQELSLPDKKSEPRKELGFQVQELTPMPSITELPEIAWLQDKLAFQNESFEELARRMERRYAVHIIFKDSLLEKERLSGVFQNENIRKALHLLQMTTPFRYDFEEDSVFLKR